MNYKIFRLKKNDKRAFEQLFMGFNDTKTEPTIDLYEQAYEGEIETEQNESIGKTLERIFVLLNIHRPSDFKGRSLSVSDVVEINNAYYYCDIQGYKRLKDTSETNRMKENLKKC